VLYRHQDADGSSAPARYSGRNHPTGNPYADLFGDAAVIQRNPALAPAQQRCDGRHQCRWLGNPRGRNSPPHVACIKGVLGDALRFEAGATRFSLALQAKLEKRHARRADLVITVSRYCAERLEELYGVSGAIVVPELIDLEPGGAYSRPIQLRPIPVNSPYCRYAGLSAKAIGYPPSCCRVAAKGDPRTRDSNRRKRARTRPVAKPLHGTGCRTGGPGRHVNVRT